MSAGPGRPGGFRFRPPAFPLPPALPWVLHRAFAPPAGAGEPPAAGGEAATLAARLGLAARIAARGEPGRLAAELGSGGAGELAGERQRALALVLAYEELAARVAAVAAELGLPLVLLKGAALHLGGHAVPGSRPQGDLDVLVPAAGAEELRRALAGAGFRAPDLPATAHHLAPVAGGAWAFVDIHTRLAGVLAGGAEATCEALAGEGLLVPAPGLPGNCRLPARRLLLAHTLAHGLDQHGRRPAGYPLLRVMADVLDLAGDDPEAGVLAAAPRLTGSLTPAELAAAARLASLLAAGRAPAGQDHDAESYDGDDGGPSTAAGLLLRHMVAGSELRGYHRALAAGHAAARLRRAGPRYLLRKLWLSDAEIELRYGRPGSRWGYLGRRLWRPLELAGRLAASALSRARLALGRQPAETAAKPGGTEPDA